MLATTIHNSNTTPHHQARRQHQKRCCLKTQQCVGGLLVVLHPAHTHYRRRLHLAHTPPDAGCVCVVLLRKEVIQPHLPVRLPCYDFVPIADPTFDSSLPYGLGHWLRVLPTFMT